MRVIAGTARGRRLDSVRGEGTRPITDRAKEALFSILQADVPDASVLDLFAGTGGVGIEALSRGASWCDFVELSPAAVRVIHANLARTGLAGRAAVLRRDVFAVLARATDRAYDLVYIAPPQYRGWWLKALTAIDAQPSWLAPGGRIVIQIHPREDAPPGLVHLMETDRRRYGSVQLQFYEHIDDALC